jgi:hypothetical protein
MQWVKIVATLYDAEGNVVGTGFTYSELDVIPPGGKSPFTIAIDQYGKDDGWLYIRGEVVNTGQSDAEWVKVVATLYDAQGNVVGAEYSYAELDVVPAGGRSPFEILLEQWEGFDSYLLQVQGQ